MRKHTRSKIIAVGLVAAASAAAPAAHATLIAYDNFGGDTPGANLSSDSSGSGFTGAWTYFSGSAAITTPSYAMNSPSSPESATSLVAQAPGGFTDALHTLASAPSTTSGTTLFFSYLVRGSDVSGSANADQVALAGTAVGTSSVVTFGTGYNTGNNDWGFQVASAYATGTAVSFTPVPGATVSANQTYLLVGELSYSGGTTDSVSMWVNPTSTNPSSAAESVTLTGTVTNSISLGTIYSVDLHVNHENGTVDFGNFALGTTFADVVPEPSSALAPLGMAGAGLLRRRRRGGRA